MEYKNYLVSVEEGIANVTLNRPEKANALDELAWKEMRQIFLALSDDPEVRVVVLKGEGKHFCAGIDLTLLMSMQQKNSIPCEGRKREALEQFIKGLQSCINAIEDCKKPVLAAVHGGAIGGAVDILTACDMRYCSADAYFTVKEIDLGLVADLGTLQRLPKLISPALTAELAYTGRKVFAEEAKASGLVNTSFESREDLYKGVNELATMIAAKSPLVIRGIKNTLKYSRDHTVQEGLNQIALYNAGFILSNDIMEAVQAHMAKRPAKFEN